MFRDFSECRLNESPETPGFFCELRGQVREANGFRVVAKPCFHCGSPFIKQGTSSEFCCRDDMIDSCIGAEPTVESTGQDFKCATIKGPDSLVKDGSKPKELGVI